MRRSARREPLAQRLRARLSSLHARITAIALLPALTLALLVGGMSVSLRHTDLNERLHERGMLLARQLAAAADYGVFSGNITALQTLVESVASEPATQAAQILDREGRVLASAGAAPPAALRPAAADRPGPAPTQTDWQAFREPVRSPRIPLDDYDAHGAVQNGNDPGIGTALVVLSTQEVQGQEQRFTLMVIAILVVILLLTGVLARRMSRRLSRPVVEAARAADRIGRGETGVRLAPSPIATLDQLVRGVNEMAVRLETSKQELEQKVLEATQQLLEKKDEAERANHAKSRFLAAASHDLRQPMHALGMFVATLSQQPSTPIQRELLAQIDRAVGAMGDLLDSLLDISRLDAGVIETRVAAMPLRPLLERIASEFAAVAQAKGLELELRRTTLWVRSDRILLERILVNLLSNAIRYTTQGRILVAARICGTQRDQVRIDVRDSGPGIAEDAREAIFQEFVQLENPERDRSKGLGLGLSIVKRLAQLLDHRIQLRSAPGAGSTFSVVLPRVPADEAQRAEAAAARIAASLQQAGAAHRAAPMRRIQATPRPPGMPPRRVSRPASPAPPGSAPTQTGQGGRPDQSGQPGPTPQATTGLPKPAEAGPGGAEAIGALMRPFEGLRILVIDDDPLVRDGLTGMLRTWGALVAASAGQASLPEQLTRAERPDLILCDLRLGDQQDGVQMLAAIRRQLGEDLPAVLITGDTDPERVDLAAGSGDPVLHKPVRPAQLRALMHSLLYKRAR